MQVERKAPSYTEAQIAALAAYIATLGPGPAIPTAEQLDTTNADLAVGGELFRTNCAQCHNFAGKGAALTEGKYAPSLMEATPQQVYEAMLTGPQNMPVFGDGTLTREKQDILKYVAHLQTQTQPGGFALGSFGPVTEGALLFTLGTRPHGRVRRLDRSQGPMSDSTETEPDFVTATEAPTTRGAPTSTRGPPSAPSARSPRMFVLAAAADPRLRRGLCRHPGRRRGQRSRCSVRSGP